VRVEPCKNRGNLGNLSGKISIFDALGNKVVNEENFERDKEKDVLIWTWNGKNTRGRTVGSGAYQAIISVDGKIHLRRIGIKK